MLQALCQFCNSLSVNLLVLTGVLEHGFSACMYLGVVINCDDDDFQLDEKTRNWRRNPSKRESKN